MSEILDFDLSYVKKWISTFPLLTREEEQTLFEKIKKGDKGARDRVLNSNMGLVINIAKRYRGKGVPMIDLIQEGFFGLVRSVSKFDNTRGIKFSTYATNWVITFISRAVQRNNNIIYIPPHTQDKLNIFCKVNNLENDKTLAEKIVRELLGDEEFKRVEEVYQLTQSFLSLHECTDLVNFVHINEIENKEFSMCKDIENKVDMEEALKILEKEEYLVICYKFGLDDYEVLNNIDIKEKLEEIKEYRCSITLNKIKNLEISALKKLKLYFKSINYEDSG